MLGWVGFMLRGGVPESGVPESDLPESDGTVTVRAESDPLSLSVDHETSGGPGLAGLSGLAGVSGLAGRPGATGCAGAGWRGGGTGVTCRTGGLCGVTGF